MSVAVDGAAVRLSGRCSAEQAEPLLAALAQGVEQVDLTGCEQLHASLLQLLMAANVTVTGEPSDFIRQWVLPSLSSP